jgi:hypothetical protein
MTESDDSPIFKVEYYSRLMSELREKVKIFFAKRLIGIQIRALRIIQLYRLCTFQIQSASNSKEQYSLLTLAPASWTQSQAASYFGLSLRAAAKASALYRENGILPKAEGNNKRKGCLTESKTVFIRFFYYYKNN